MNFFWTKTRNNPSTFVMAHILFVPFCFSFKGWAHQLMQQRVEARFRRDKKRQTLSAGNVVRGWDRNYLSILSFLWNITILAYCIAALIWLIISRSGLSNPRESKSNTQLSAATALLNLTCDAVVELDEDGRLLSHSSSLAAVLMRNRPGATLEGTKFIDFVAPADSERVSELLENHGRDSKDTLAYAYAFRTHLVDSYASKFRTEVFQVKYTMESGETCHIIGLRQGMAGHTA